jgi:hypothetical protein
MRIGTHLLVPKPGRFGKPFKTPRLRAKDLMGAANFTAGGVAVAGGVVVFNGAVGGARAANVPLDFPVVGTTIVEGGSARIDGTKASKSKPKASP